ncbi:hypothetical protein GS535_03525 [Saccharibacter sp. EH611]|uniref:hypothetical protein n=1 Tax=unclassified Saccharibacter TaxID=2648722 RepID=UPI00132AEF01|nr:MULTISPECIES: hypothetical protein [unclassified Saccharibacter]MXV35627.1 hypothetical protein [Saccharibacter sp. EH611]MXV65761.1 hypothetical protein [Saccharibacter sp. EH60]
MTSFSSWQRVLSRKEILEFSRAMYPGDVGPEDVLEAACLFDAWQAGKITLKIEPERNESVPEGEEKPSYCSLNDLRVLVSIKEDNQELSLKEQIYQERTTLADAQQALKKRTILAICFGGVAAIEAAYCFAWICL